VCDDCGCEAIPVIESLMDDHAAMAVWARRITETLEQQRSADVGALTHQLAGCFRHHVEVEHVGLFSQLREAGEASEQVDRLSSESHRLSNDLSDPALSWQSDRLRTLLADVVRYGKVENEELYPLALRRLPTRQWGPIENVHQRMLTV
jgi:hypothetical protein